MTGKYRRRDFLKSAAVTPAIVGLGELGGLAQLGFAKEPTIKPVHGRIDAETDRLARLIHKTPREKLVGVMIKELRKGITYRHFLGALYVENVRHTAFHKILGHHPVHQLSMDVPREERLLPLFWHLDTTKVNPRNFREPERSIKGPLPSPAKAASVFDEAMDKSDRDTAKRAFVALARSEGPKAAFYRNLRRMAFRDAFSHTLGHRVIWGSYVFRSHESTGWQVATDMDLYRIPLVSNPAGPSRANMRLASQSANRIPADWAAKRSDKAAVLHLLSIIREGKPAVACKWAHDQLLAGKLTAGTIWDAVFLGTGELMFSTAIGRAAHIVHATNGLHFAFRTVTDTQSRLFILLQSVDWAASQMQLLTRRQQLRGLKITEIPKVDSPKSATDAVEEIFTTLPPFRVQQWTRDRSQFDKAAQLTFAYAGKHADHRLFMQTARRVLCMKATSDVHCVKFPVAMFEHYQHISPRWRPHLLAATAHFLHGTQIEDNPAVQQAREELRKL